MPRPEAAHWTTKPSPKRYRPPEPIFGGLQHSPITETQLLRLKLLGYLLGAIVVRTRIQASLAEPVSAEMDVDQLYREHVDNRRRCRAKLSVSEAALDSMVTTFLTSHDSVTTCPTAYAVTSRQYRG
jgi:hypothetical protein